MKKYYAEEIQENSPFRESYEKSLEEFLKTEKARADKTRFAFFSVEEFLKKQENYREKFIDMLGFPLREKRETPTLKEKIFVAEDKNIKIYRMQLIFFNKIVFYGLYFEQIENANGAPFVLALHGYEGTPEVCASIHKNSSNYNHLVRRLTDMGANVFVPQLLMWNKQTYGGEYDREKTDGKLRQLGGSMTALELYLLRGSIDYFIEREGVLENAIGVAGLSYGGMYALHLAALDVRVKACYSCSWVNDVFEHSRPDWSYFNAQNTFTAAEVGALVCPRTLLVAMGNNDQLFDSRKTESEYSRIRLFYQQAACLDNLRIKIFSGLHETDRDNAELEILLKKIKENS